MVFYARLGDDMEWPQPADPYPVVMDQVVTNEGRAYNATTGNFTAPVDGDYFFTVTSKSTSSSGSPNVELMLDDQRLFRTDSGHPTAQAALRLRAGQHVWLRCFFRSLYGRGMYFSGVLVNPVLPK